jgi:hypothetical protein
MMVAGCRMKSHEAGHLTCGQACVRAGGQLPCIQTHRLLTGWTHIIAGLTPHSWSGCGTLSPLLRATQPGDDALLCACQSPRPRSGLANCTRYNTVATPERDSPRPRLYYIESLVSGCALS